MNVFSHEIKYFFISVSLEPEINTRARFSKNLIKSALWSVEGTQGFCATYRLLNSTAHVHMTKVSSDDFKSMT